MWSLVKEGVSRVGIPAKGLSRLGHLNALVVQNIIDEDVEGIRRGFCDAEGAGVAPEMVD